jgi:VacB/RNase II family 3'-5' exoribonuclease
MNQQRPGASRGELKDIARRAMIARGLQPDFSRAALAEAAAIVVAPMDSGSAIRDLRPLLWASIDNDDSRDLDQLTVAVPSTEGAVRILVAVADVDAAVKKGTAIDDHARANTTSVYTAAAIFPMLPESLSTDLTSLNEGVDRLAVIVDLTVAKDGTVAASDVYRALVHNQAKLAYNSVAAWLDGTQPPPARLAAVPGLDEQIRIQDRVAQAMKELRHSHGALTLETSEARPVFEGDVLVDLKPDEKNRAKSLIEDFMVAANGAVSRFLDKKGFPVLRRVLRTPERWDRIVEIAKGLGEVLSPAPDARALEAFLGRRRAADPAHFQDLSLSVIKLLGNGEYALGLPGQRTADGHFGLAVRDYSHSTAPNRRFPDLITHRLLKAALDGRRPAYDEDELRELAAHCTQQEDNAAKVERQVRKSAAARLLSSQVGQSFDAIVTGASAKGTWVRISRPPVEGRVIKGFEGMDVGDAVRVELVHTDVERGFIDFVRSR